MENYHSDYEYYSRSFLTKFEKSPLAALHAMNEKKEPTPAMLFGSAYHAYMDGTFERDYVTDLEICLTIGGAKPRATNAYKEWVAAQTKIIFSIDSLAEIIKMKAQLEQNSVVKRINAFDLVQEEPFRAIVDGFKIKCKPDGLQLNRGKDGEHLIIDWKTTDDLKYLKNNIIKYGYDVQAAMYCDIISQLHGGESNMLFIFQEKNAPYEVMPVFIKAGGEMMAEGRRKWKQYATLANECFLKNHWPAASDMLIEKCLIF